MSDTVTINRPCLSTEALDDHWRDYHRMKHMERRLIALGRTDIIEDAEKYADERMKNA